MFGVIVSLIVFMLILVLVLLYHLLLWGPVIDAGRVWVSPFECGFLGSVLTENVFSYTYFVLLVFFVIFDLEVSLLLNLPYQGILFKNFGFYLFFLVIMGLGYGLELGSGYVSWNY
uniref:NADH-ubiquinone oxidoreductase chain 3 n=1 Tax=Cyathocotyle prussica TaxID=2067575 RepID=A0A6J3YMF4_9TREM|nr:NADH dehydrogenase subunit 3 [Cyathocotyle prussica]AYH51389.1 NADH dehydrogenase subunit 3 [Cyathocotyle prussica]